MSFLSAQEIFHFIRSSNISPRISGTDYFPYIESVSASRYLIPSKLPRFGLEIGPETVVSPLRFTRQRDSSRFSFRGFPVKFVEVVLGEFADRFFARLASPRISLKFSWKSHREIVDSPVERNSAEGGLANAT